MAAELTPEQREAIAQSLYAGQKIDAIKQLRELSGLGLKESKDVIDRLETDLRTEHPERFKSAPGNRRGCVTVLFFIVAAAALAWFLFKR